MPSSASAPEPGDQRAPAVVADQDALQELERAQVVGLAAQVARASRGLGSARPAARRSASHSAPRRAGARARRARARHSPPSGLRSSAASERSSRGGRGDAQRREQVLDRELAADAQHVGAGDRHARALQRPDDRVRRAAAPLHQDHHVAGADRAAAGGARQRAAGVEPAARSSRRCAVGQRLDRVVGRAARRPARPRGSRPASPASAGTARARPGPARRRRSDGG